MAVLTQSSFTAGEVDPSLWGRKDQGIYHSGLRKAVNMIVHEGGGIYNREGFRFVGRVKDETRGARLLHFRFTTGDEYVIEAGHKYFRFWRDDAAVLDLDSAKTSFVSLTRGRRTNLVINGHGFVTGDQVYIQGVQGVPEINRRMFRVSRTDANSFEVLDPTYGGAIDSSEWGGGPGRVSLSSGVVQKPYEIATPYRFDDTHDDVFGLDYSQAGDIVTIVSENHPVYDLSRLDHDKWTMAVKVFSAYDLDGKQVNSSALFGSDPANVANVGEGDEKTGLYPSVVSFFQQRRILGARSDTPDTLLYSEIGDYDQFSANQQVSDDTAFAATLATPTLSTIQHVIPLKEDIIILTDEAQWAARSVSGQGFAARSLSQSVQLNVGAEKVRPVSFDDDVVFIRKGARAVMNIRYDGNIRSFVPNELSFSAKHVFACGNGRVNSLATWYDRLRRVAAVTDEGQIAHLSVNNAYQLAAWTRWVTPGGRFVYVSAADNAEKMYAVVRREVGGLVRHFIEVTEPHRRDSSLHNQFFLDSGVSSGRGAGADFVEVNGREKAFFDSEVFYVDDADPEDANEYDVCTPSRIVSLGGSPVTYDDLQGYIVRVSFSRVSNSISAPSGILPLMTGEGLHPSNFSLRGDLGTSRVSLFIPKEVVDKYPSVRSITAFSTPTPINPTIRPTTRRPDLAAAFVQGRRLVGARSYLGPMRAYIGEGNLDENIYVLDNGIAFADDNVRSGQTPQPRNAFAETTFELFYGGWSILPATDPYKRFYVVVEDEESDLFRVYVTNDRYGVDTWLVKGVFIPSADFYGLSHLEGRTVSALVDGSVHPNLVVLPGGRINISPATGNVASAGLPYRCEIETLDLDLQTGGDGTSDQLQSASEITVKVHESRGIKYRVTTSQSELQELPIRHPETPMGSAEPLVTDDVLLPVQSPWARSMRVALVQDDPLPMTILAITPEFELQDRR